MEKITKQNENDPSYLQDIHTRYETVQNVNCAAHYHVTRMYQKMTAPILMHHFSPQLKFLSKVSC